MGKSDYPFQNDEIILLFPCGKEEKLLYLPCGNDIVAVFDTKRSL